MSSSDLQTIYICYSYFQISYSYNTRLFPLCTPMLDLCISTGREHASSYTQNAHNSYPFPLPPDASWRFPQLLLKSNIPLIGAYTTFGISLMALGTFILIYT